MRFRPYFHYLRVKLKVKWNTQCSGIRIRRAFFGKNFKIPQNRRHRLIIGCVKGQPPVIEYDFKYRKRLFGILGAGFIARLTIPGKTTSSVGRKAFILVIVDWVKAGIEQKEAIGWVRSLTTLAEGKVSRFDFFRGG